jgi:cyclophilin family peptidyl-prolyl cis-trans isomerase
MAQGGDPQGNGTGGPGYSIACECYRPDYRRHFRGSLSMAHAGRDTGGSQFFLTFVPTDMLNGKHTVFGRIVEGIDVLAKLQRIDPEHPKGEKPDTIEKATVVRKRKHDYVPNKKAA